jgi:hypothetical protein
MKREVQLYIQDTRVDLFQDETISVTDSIQNVSDISKVFTPFSKQFNLPASSTNNKLFKHYYNFDIQDGFDARFTVDARIEINHVPFKSGKLRLNGVGMKENHPHTYKVVFFGEPNSLKELFGDEDLSSLNGLSTLDIKSDSVTGDVENAFKTGLRDSGNNATGIANRNIVVPLITLQNYYSYDTPSTNELKNVNWSILKKELKPAIKVKKIIEAIQTQYNLTFNMSDDGSLKTFFGSDVFDELYLWLHRQKAPHNDLNNTAQSFGINYNSLGVKKTLSDYTIISGGGTDVLSGGKLTINEGESYSTTSAMTVAFTGLTSGNLSSRVFDPEIRFNNNTSQLISFSAQTTLLNFGLEIDKTVNGVTTQHFYANNAFQFDYMIFIQDYLPKMKVIDFLTGLFKMFNLVA